MKSLPRATIVVTFLVVTSLMIAILPHQSARGASYTLTFTPEADASVNQAHRNTNDGTGAQLSVDGSPIIRSYLRFNVTGLSGATITAAKLRVYVVDDSASGFSVAKADSNSWTETGITYRKAPGFGSAYGSIGAYGASQWIEIPIDGAVTGEGQVTLVMLSDYDTTTAVASRETGANAPQLVLTLISTSSTQPSATSTTKPLPSATIPPTRTPTPTNTATLPPAPTNTPLPTATRTPTATPSQSAQPTPFGQGGSWRLVFHDEFDGTALDTTKWHTCFWWATDTCSIESNHELELYNRDDILVQNGSLRLRAQKRDLVGWNGVIYHYTSGMVMTGGRKYEKPPEFTFTYGYAEARVKVPAGQGLWPAFWMLPVSYNSRPEIDIMEILGHQPNVQHMNYHYVGGDSGATWTGPDFSAGWHTFAVDWEPSAIIWYVDGVERYRFTNTAYISNEPMYVLLNLAVGGDWPGAPNSSTVFPSYYDIDYVRIWQK
jgi:beta-glucanase (GH16 family)